MNRVQFFTDSIAMTLRAELTARGITLPVVGAVTDPEPEGERLEVRCESCEELIPGNATVRLDCQLGLNLAASCMTAEEIEAELAAVGEACMAVLRQSWRGRALDDPRGGDDEEYQAAPFLVLEMVPEVAVPEVNGASYEGVLAFRAYVQF